MDYERLAYCCRERSKREMEDATQITLEEAATAITDLLARAEEAEKERDEEKQRRLYAESHAEAFLKDCEDLNNKLEIMDAENKRYAQLCNAQDKRIDELQSMAEEHKTKKDTAIRLIETIMGSQKYCALCKNIACKNSDTREAACKPIWNGRCD